MRTLLGPPGDKVIKAPRGVRSYHGDIRDLSAMCHLLQGVDVIVHAAGPPSVIASFKSPILFESVHVGGTVTLLQAASQSRVRRFIYISSAEVYGQRSAAAVSELDLPDPRSPYGAAKLAAENFVRTFSFNSGIEGIILRPFSIYGPNGSARSLVGTVLRQALSGEVVRVNDLRPVRDYCYVDDLARGVIRACKVSAVDTVVFNIGTGIGTSVAELARTAVEITGRKIPIQENSNCRRQPRHEILQLIANRDRARDMLGWEPEVELMRGLRFTIESLRSV